MHENEYRLMDTMDNGLAIVDDTLAIHYWNPWLSNHTRVPREQAVGGSLPALFPDINRRSLERKIRSALSLQSTTYYTPVRQGYLLRIPSERIANPIFEHMQQSVSIVPFDVENRLVILAVYDQTPLREIQHKLERKMAEIEALSEKLATDVLTGLPTRPKLLDDITRSDFPALAFLNLESFKEINDLYGHQVGDEVLKDVAQRLVEAYADGPYVIYKMPADEYAVLGVGVHPSVLLEKSCAVVDAMHNVNFVFEGHEIPLSLTAGIGYCKETLMRDADMALRKAKEDPSTRCLIYDESIDEAEQYERNLRSVNVVKHAVQEDWVVPHFQPIVSTRTGLPEKYESLIRIVDDADTVWSPFHFLGPAKKARLYHHLTKAMIEKSAATFRDTDYEFSINLSVEDILNSDTVYFLAETLERHDVYRRTVLEITETEGIENYKEVSSFIRRMQDQGCKIAIDDFGSGYSNFEYLLKLNVDYIKIDGSIIKNLDSDANSRIVAETIVDFARKLGVRTIGEFVHSQQILDIITDLGIDYAQGFFTGKPATTLIPQCES